MKVINQQQSSQVYQNSENGKRETYPNGFGAYNTNDLREDTVNIANKAGNKVKENWMVSMVKDAVGFKTAKQFITSVGLAVLTTVGIAYLGNKMSNKTAELGLAVDKKIVNQGWYKKLTGGISSVKEKTKDFILKHSATARDIADTFKNRHAKAKWDLARGYGRGFVNIFALTPVDILGKVFKKDASNYSSIKSVLDAHKSAMKTLRGMKAGDKGYEAAKEAVTRAREAIKQKVKDSGSKSAYEMLTSSKNSIIGSIKKLVGSEDGGKTAAEIADNILGVSRSDNREFCEKLSDAMRKHFKCGKDHSKFLECLKQMQTGKININGVTADVSEFKDVVMSEKGFHPIGPWWPVNLIRNGISKITGKPSKIGLGNLGDSLVKFNVANGSLADSSLGSLVQKAVTIPCESISNFVNDKSGLGVFLCAATLKPLYDTLQTAPKEKRKAIAADDLVSTMGSIAIATPLAYGTAYGLATLNNMKGTTVKGKLLKGFGRIFNIGLDKYGKDGKKIVKELPAFSEVSGIIPKTKLFFKKAGQVIPAYTGGAGRFVLIGMVLSGMFSKPIRKVIHKVFGDPNEKPNMTAREEQIMKAMQEAARQNALYRANNSENGSLNRTGRNQTSAKPASMGSYVPASRTNLITQWTGGNEAPAAAQNIMPQQNIYGMNAQYVQNPYAQQMFYNNMNAQYAQNPYLQSYYTQAPAPVQVQNVNNTSDSIAAAKLNTEKNSGEKKKSKYVPSIQVDNSYVIEQENALNEKVSTLLKSTDTRINRLSKSLHG